MCSRFSFHNRLVVHLHETIFRPVRGRNTIMNILDIVQ